MTLNRSRPCGFSRAGEERRSRDIARMTVSDGRATLSGRALFTDAAPELFGWIEQELAERSAPRLVMTLNVDQVLRLDRDPEFLRLYRESAVRVIDGMPVLWLARWLGLRGGHRHTGADLIFELSAASASRGWRVAIVGGRGPAAQLAASALQRLYPGAGVTAVPFPMLGDDLEDDTSAVVAELVALRPDITFICLGSPKQENWFGRNRELLPPGIYIGAGAAVDFAAGTSRRAPRPMQALGLEWLWRVLWEPRRLARRYFIDGPWFMAVIARSARRA